MMPGMDPRKMRQAMKKMGIEQEEVDDAHEVIIRCSEREIVISEPQVTKVSMMGQMTYQIAGAAHERAIKTTPDISDEDVKTVADQAGCSQEQAREALERTKGDIAEAIMQLQG